MNCWIQGVPLSRNIVDFQRLVEKKAERVLVDDSFLNIILSLLQFKEVYRDADKVDPMVIAQSALALDANLDEYARDLAQEAPFENRQLLDAEHSHFAHKGYFHCHHPQMRQCSIFAGFEYQARIIQETHRFNDHGIACTASASSKGRFLKFAQYLSRPGDARSRWSHI
ncbi:hypothetical protein AA0113_g9607 [Alternaria arborescens]|uniref:Uncharacterized protein n=1 Tax=Alternaria arborescens TaxID=156630 RepID=A0A4Q4R951_9PLEO|nr:hypothetical protein AA0113_g9607 [Alternaria arborescens]